MRRTTSLTAATALALAALAPTTGAASAAGETCRGEAATIVGQPKQEIVGTEGRDVIVAAGARRVDSLGGDDVICILDLAGVRDRVSVDAGAGDDVVDTTGVVRPGQRVSVTLGAGADAFAGGGGKDSVSTGARADSGGYADLERDTVDTGAGDDSVYSGQSGVPNHDAIALGTGKDELGLDSAELAPDAVVDGGGNADSLDIDSPVRDAAVDLTAGTFTTSLGAARFGSFEHSYLTVDGPFTFRGTDGRDVLDVTTGDTVPVLDIATGGGDDALLLEPARLGAGSRVDLGAGDDLVVAGTLTGRLELDLPAQRLAVGDVEVPASGIERAFLMAPSVAMVGDAADNSLAWSGCDGSVTGGAGDDSLSWQYDFYYETYEFRCTGTVSMDGGGGDDDLRGSASDDRLTGGAGIDRVQGVGGDDRIRGGAGGDDLDGGEGDDVVRGEQGADELVGQSGADVLIGGPGRDRADGSAGRDRCSTEVRTSCER